MLGIRRMQSTSLVTNDDANLYRVFVRVFVSLLVLGSNAVGRVLCSQVRVSTAVLVLAWGRYALTPTIHLLHRNQRHQRACAVPGSETERRAMHLA